MPCLTMFILLELASSNDLTTTIHLKCWLPAWECQDMLKKKYTTISCLAFGNALMFPLKLFWHGPSLLTILEMIQYLGGPKLKSKPIYAKNTTMANRTLWSVLLVIERILLFTVLWSVPANLPLLF